jgi:hypothetical protein
MCIEDITSIRLEGPMETTEVLSQDGRFTTEIRTKKIPNTSQNRHHFS